MTLCWMANRPSNSTFTANDLGQRNYRPGVNGLRHDEVSDEPDSVREGAEEDQVANQPIGQRSGLGHRVARPPADLDFKSVTGGVGSSGWLACRDQPALCAG